MTLANLKRISIFSNPLVFLGLCLLIGFTVLFISSEGQQAKVLDTDSKSETIQKMPNLKGEEAEEYLKEQGLYKSLNEAIQASRYSINRTKNASLPIYKEAFQANNPRQAFTTYFAKDGIHLVSRAKNNKWRIKMNLEKAGYGENLLRIQQGKMQVQNNKSRIEIEKLAVSSEQLAVNKQQSKIQNPESKIVEWFENRKDGLEQGWTINEKLYDSKEELKLVLKLGGDLQSKLAKDKQSVQFFRGKGEPVLRYSKLKSWDANGKELASRMELKNKELSIVVDDIQAKYPITVDPFFTQTKKLVASDAAGNDKFSRSVAISGDTAIVGAHNNDDNGADSGSAYIFERNTGGANNWGEVKKLIASDAAAGDEFGFSVGISGDKAIVGAYRNDDAGTASGSAYIFERNTGGANNWGEVKKIVAADAAGSDQFGRAVAISNDTVIIGSRFDDDDGSRSGSAYIFERNTGGADNWGEVKKIDSSDGTDFDNFGISVGISIDTVIIGADRNDDDGVDSGSAYIFERNTGGANNWGEAQKITAADASGNDRYGLEVAISQGTAIVGAIDNDDAGASSGSAYIYTDIHNNWSETIGKVASDGTAADLFGSSVSISGDTAIVGARDDDNGFNSGSAYIFERNMGGANNWGEVKKLIASDVASLDLFGSSVGISGDIVIVGASGNDDAGSLSGSAYIFERNTGGVNNWGEVKKLTASDAAGGDQFGNSVGISGDTAIVGANSSDDAGSSSGSAYIFERNTGGANNWGEVKKLTASDADGDDVFGDSVGISGDTAIVGATENSDAGPASGSAYIFERNQGGVNNWGEVKKLTASDADGDDFFGNSVGISGDTAIIGASRDIDGGLQSGSAYIFERNQGGANNWGEVKKLIASDAASFDFFGSSVGISGDIVIVGASGNSDAGPASGSAYIFERNQGGVNNWGEVKKLIASDAASGDSFGFSVAISGNKAIVGASSVDVAALSGSNSKRSSKLNRNRLFAGKDSQNLAGADQGKMYIFNAIAAPTAANASVSGRVLSSGKGRGVARAIVQLSDQNGNIRTVRTNQFGYFYFDDIEVGQTLILNAFHKRYQFNTQVINFDNSITELKIIAQ